MIFREAYTHDIPQIQVIRHAVKENVLSDPALVTDKDCEEFIHHRGKGWVCEINNKVVGFAIADLKEQNIWALFVHPQHEGKGIGKKLHAIMLDWYFRQGPEKVWLGTATHTRAAAFYNKAGWTETGKVNKGELKFEISAIKWRTIRAAEI